MNLTKLPHTHGFWTNPEGDVFKRGICCDNVHSDYHATVYRKSHFFIEERRVCNSCFDKWGDRYEEWVDSLGEL